MSINIPRSPEKRKPKYDAKKPQSAIDKVREETKDKVHKVIRK